jgi:hypothetical protein
MKLWRRWKADNGRDWDKTVLALINTLLSAQYLFGILEPELEDPRERSLSSLPREERAGERRRLMSHPAPERRAAVIRVSKSVWRAYSGASPRAKAT